MNNPYAESAKYESARRVRWLPKPPDGMVWQVFRLPGALYEVMLSRPSESTYTKRWAAWSDGRIRLWLGGREMIRNFERDKRYSMTADEFVERMSRKHLDA